MIVYYVVTTSYSIGSFNKEKIIKMYGHSKILECDISEFTGHLLSSEYLT